MKNILVPIDGSDAALRALKVAIQIVGQQKEPSSLHILNVQPPLASNNAAHFFTPDVLKSYYDDAGKDAMNNAKKLLATLAIPYSTHIEVGPVLDVIKNYTHTHQCDHIIMGTRGLGAIPGLLLGSVATKVLNGVDIPVTLIK